MFTYFKLLFFDKLCDYLLIHLITFLGDKGNGTPRKKFSFFDLKNLFLTKNRLNGKPKPRPINRLDICIYLYDF